MENLLHREFVVAPDSNCPATSLAVHTAATAMMRLDAGQRREAILFIVSNWIADGAIEDRVQAYVNTVKVLDDVQQMARQAEATKIKAVKDQAYIDSLAPRIRNLTTVLQ